MKNVKLIKELLALGACTALCQCASTQNASVADYNGDGVISDAEYRQFSKQKSVERQNVYTERAKRDNASDTIRDTRNAAGDIRSLQNILRSF